MTTIKKNLEQYCLRRHEKIIRPFIKKEDSFYGSFHSMDVLHIRSHKHVKEKIIEYTLKWGSGHSHSKTVDALRQQQEVLEKRLAQVLGVETILFLPVYHKNIAKIFQTISPKPLHTLSRFISPDENLSFQEHASLLEETITIDQDTLEIFYYQTFDPFNKAKMHDFTYLVKELGGYSVIDDSLSFTNCGKNGFGMAAMKTHADMLIGQFPKDVGSFCSFLGISAEVKEYLIYVLYDLFAPPLLTAPILGAIEAYLDLIPHFNEERSLLEEITIEFQQKMQYTSIYQDHHLFLIPMPSPEVAKDIWSKLYKANILTTIASYPKKHRLEYYIKGYLHILLQSNAIEEMRSIISSIY